MNIIQVNGYDVYNVYTELIKKVKNIDRKYAITAIVTISSLNTNTMPKKIGDNEISTYYNEIISNNLFDRWNRNNNDWYFSYTRNIFYDKTLKNNEINFEKAYKILSEDKNSRRAIISTSIFNSKHSEGFPALLDVIFYISQNKLFMTTIWRSKELSFAFPINCIEMFSLFKLMFMKLKKVYYNLKIGSYSEFITNLHLNDACENKFLANNKFNISNKQIKFYWSIIDYKQEGDFDEYYQQ